MPLEHEYSFLVPESGATAEQDAFQQFVTNGLNQEYPPSWLPLSESAASNRYLDLDNRPATIKIDTQNHCVIVKPHVQESQFPQDPIYVTYFTEASDKSLIPGEEPTWQFLPKATLVLAQVLERTEEGFIQATEPTDLFVYSHSSSYQPSDLHHPKLREGKVKTDIPSTLDRSFHVSLHSGRPYSLEFTTARVDHPVKSSRARAHISYSADENEGVRILEVEATARNHLLIPPYAYGNLKTDTSRIEDGAVEQLISSGSYNDWQYYNGTFRHRLSHGESLGQATTQKPWYVDIRLPNRFPVIPDISAIRLSDPTGIHPEEDASWRDFNIDDLGIELVVDMTLGDDDPSKFRRTPNIGPLF